MADVVTPEIRSRMMSGIRGRDTKPELILRRGLHKLGFRFRLHAKELPGRPDLIFPKYHAALFIHGCFWHGHGCHLFKWPQSRVGFWKKKITGNKLRDEISLQRLDESGWRYGIVWECALKGTRKLPQEKVMEQCAQWLQSKRAKFELGGG